jgi:hypothetical protein
MASNPITIKESINNFNTTRQDYMMDNNRKFGGSGKFNFRKYKTDKERIEEYKKEKEMNLRRQVKPKDPPCKQDEKTHHSVEQPIMRFKPRTDLERLYYSINEYSYGKISKDVINEQLKRLNLSGLKKNEEENNQDLNFLKKFDNIDEKTLEELLTQKEFLNKQGYNEKNSETVKQISLILDHHNKKHIKNEDDPSRFKSKQAWRTHVNKKAARRFLVDYNKKTHFKGASLLSFNMDDFKSKSLIKQNQNKTQENFLNFNSYDEPENDQNENNMVQYNGTTSNFYSGNKSNFFENNSTTAHNEFYNTTNDFSKFNNTSFKKSNQSKNNLADMNTKISNMDFNPLLKKTEEYYDPKILIYLKRISQTNNITDVNGEMPVVALKGLGFLSNLKLKNSNNTSMKSENSNLFNQINLNINLNNLNEIEEMRKCNFLNFK